MAAGCDVCRGSTAICSDGLKHGQPDDVGDVSAALAMGGVKRWGIDKVEKTVEVTVIQGGVDVV